MKINHREHRKKDLKKDINKTTEDTEIQRVGKYLKKLKNF